MFDGSIIKKLRNEMNLNQSELAERVKCTQANISSYETNRTRPDVDVLINLAKVFNKSTDYLLGLTDVTLDTLNENERYLIDIYRSFKREHQIEVLNIMKFLDKLGD